MPSTTDTYRYEVRWTDHAGGQNIDRYPGISAAKDLADDLARDMRGVDVAKLLMCGDAVRVLADFGGVYQPRAAEG